MKLTFNKIHIENFMSIGNADIDLDNRGYTLVSGVNNRQEDLARSNGSGKSSIFEAIVWCLTGDTMRGIKDVVNNYGTDGALVEIEFNLDNHKYVLQRSKDHSKFKTNLLINIDNEDKSGKGIRDSEKLLKEYIPDLTTSLIGSVIILGQGLPNRFTNNSPSGRKEVLEKLCKSDFMIEDLKNRINNRKSELQASLRETEDKLLTLNTKLNIETNSLNNDENSLNLLLNNNDYDSSIAEIEKQLNELFATKEKLNTEFETTNDSLNTLHNQQITLQQELDVEKDNYTKDHSGELIKTQEEVNDINVNYRVKYDELQKLKNITDICPTCKQKLPDVHKPDTTQLEQEVKELNDKKLNLTSKLQQLKTDLDNGLKAIQNVYNEKVSLVTNTTTMVKNSLSKLRNDQWACDDNIIKLQKELSAYQISKQTHNDNIKNYQNQIEQHKQNIEAINNDILYNTNVKQDIEERCGIISQFNTVITRDFRGYLLKSIIEYIDTRAKEYSQDIFETQLIDFYIDGNNIAISYNNKQYEALSGGEKQKVDLIIQFSIRDMLCTYTNFGTNIIALDEIFDNLDDLGSQKIIDLISNKLSDISSVFIISHHGNELNIPCDNEILVTKDENGVSTIK